MTKNKEFAMKIGIHNEKIGQIIIELLNQNIALASKQRGMMTKS